MVDLPASRELECPEEELARSSLSPGPVLDCEELGRFLYRHDHLTANGDVAPAALPVADLLDPSRDGLSFGRLSHLTASDIRSLGADYKARHPANTFHGFGVVLTARVRQLLTIHRRRELCVVDDAQDGFPAHALLQLSDRRAYNKGSVRRLRSRLLDLIAVRRADLFIGRSPSS